MKVIQVLEHRTKLLSKYDMVDKTDPSPGIGNQVVLKAWTLSDDRTQSDLTLHCTDVQEQMVDQLKTSKEVWDKLETTYDQNT
jgi:hypothetical protein